MGMQKSTKTRLEKHRLESRSQAAPALWSLWSSKNTRTARILYDTTWSAHPSQHSECVALGWAAMGLGCVEQGDIDVNIDV